MPEEIKKEEMETPEAENQTDVENSETDEENVEAETVEEEKAEEEKNEDLQAQFLRLSADFQNFRRRTEAEKADIYAFANEKIVLQILDVIDNFDRAMSTAPADDKFAEGMQMILKQLLDVLDKNKVIEIDALDKDFDPKQHNAVMTEEVEGKESGKVTQVLQKGYTLNGKVIRPAMVAVSK